MNYEEERLRMEAQVKNEIEVQKLNKALHETKALKEEAARLLLLKD
jgi:hypothetical protein